MNKPKKHRKQDTIAGNEIGCSRVDGNEFGYSRVDDQLLGLISYFHS